MGSAVSVVGVVSEIEEDDEDERKLREMFNELDDDGSGSISPAKLAQLFKNFGAPILNVKSVENLMKRAKQRKLAGEDFDEDDGDENEELFFSYEDFSFCFLSAVKAFREIDKDGNGVIDASELQEALYTNSLSNSSNLALFNVEQIDAKQLIERFDIKHDGLLDFPEFFLLFDLASQTKLANVLSFLVSSSCVFADSPFIVQRPANPLTSFLCGAFAGAVSRTATAPISRLIVLSQVSTGNDTLTSFAKRIMKREGIVGFWRGNLATVAKIAPSVAINLTVYDELDPVISKLGIAEKTSLAFVIKGALAGCVSTAATYPMDSIRTVLSLEGSSRKSFKDAVKEIGAKNLFNGLGLAMIEVAPNMAVRYYLFEKAKVYFVKRLHTEIPTYTTIIAASSFAACASQAVTYPLVVIRRNQQTQNLSSMTAFRQIWTKFGVKGFYRGVGANLVSIVPSVAIGFGGYEMLKKKFAPSSPFLF